MSPSSRTVMKESLPHSAHTLLAKAHQRSHLLRGERVVLEADAADLFGVSLTRLPGALRRHPERFPIDLAFQLNEAESLALAQRRGRPPCPYAFTETGLLMLSSLLKTPQAVATGIEIVRELFAYQKN